MTWKNMAVTKIFPLLLLLNVLSVNADRRTERQEASSKTSFDEILKPPPPPPLSTWLGGQRHQRQNQFGQLPNNFRMPAPFSRPSNYGPPFPYHNQFRHNPPAPMPFFTTQSPPSLFQKVSKWLFPPAAPGPTGTHISSSSIDNDGANLNTPKKDCNPCNLVPWLPVLRYQAHPISNLGPLQNLIGNTAPGHPTYGPPQPNLQANAQNIAPPFVPAPGQNYNGISAPSQNFDFPKLSYPTGFKNSYGEPITSKYPAYQVSGSGAESSKLNALPDASEYRPSIYKPVNLDSHFTQFKGSNSLVSGNHNQPLGANAFSSPNLNQKNPLLNSNSLGNNVNFLGGAPFTVSNSNNKNQHSISHSLTPPNTNNQNQYQSANSFTASNLNHQNQASTTLSSSNFNDQNQNKGSSQIQYHISSFSSPNSNIQTQYHGSSFGTTSLTNSNRPLTSSTSPPNSKITHSSSNSYTSTNTNFQTAKEESNLQSLSTVNNVNQQQASSSFVSQNIHDHNQQSVSNALTSPGLVQNDLQNSPYYTNVTSNAPSVNHHSNYRGRGIQTLQPVPFPNLSVSPLPPIFNAKPFKPSIPYVDQVYPPQNLSPIIVDDPSPHNSNNNIQIIPSIPIAEFTSSVDYPITIIQAPVLDVDKVNQTKNYAPSGGNLEQTAKDTASQASEPYTASASSTGPTANQNGQFVGNYNYFLPNVYHTTAGPVKSPNVPPNHRPSFADLRGILSTGVDDAFGSEQNLQAIDSPILYLKPNTPHKEFEKFYSSTLPTTITEDYAAYDEVPTSIRPPLPTASDNWANVKYTDFTEGISPPPTVPVPIETQETSTKKPKVLQIIIPYTSNVNPSAFKLPIPIGIDSWTSTKLEDAEHVGRRVPQVNRPYEISSQNTIQKGDAHISTTLPATESIEPTTEFYESLRINTNQNSDMYDVKEPPFDILTLQHNIDGWTEQEFAKHYQAQPQVNVNGNFAKAKKIPDEYFTTPQPLQSYPSTINDINTPFFDHEFASSIRHSKEHNLHNVTVIANIDNTLYQSNLIVPSTDRTPKSRKEGKHQPFIYTAASSFRSLSSTTAPWGKIQTSISPLTKEKVYVVTAQPWRESNSSSGDGVDFESTRNTVDSERVNDTSASGSNVDTIFKSPRFAIRPSPALITNPASSEENLDNKFGYKWHLNINDLEEASSTIDYARRPKYGVATTEGATHRLESSTHEDPSATTQASVHTLEGAQRRNSTES